MMGLGASVPMSAQPRFTASLSKAETRRRERLQELLIWLSKTVGETGGPMPAYVEIGTHLRIAGTDRVSQVVRTAAALGLIVIEGGRGKRSRFARVLPAGSALAGLARPARRGADSFAAWLSRAAPGERHTYFVGHLAEARQQAALSGCTAAIAAALQDAAEAAEAAESGLVILTARRVVQGFEYQATLRRVHRGDA